MRLPAIGLLVVAVIALVARSAPAAPKLRVLIVAEAGVKSTGDFRRALATEMTVTVATPDKVPAVPGQLAYDVVVLSDVAADKLGASQVAALDAFVRGGGALLAAGGEHSFATGAYQATRLEAMFPVRFDADHSSRGGDLAVVVALDTSAAMKGKPLELATGAITALAAAMSPNDYLGVIGYDAAATARVRLQRAANRTRITDEASRISAAAGTSANLFAGLREAFETLQGIRATAKHVIVVSNAPSPDAGVADLVEEMRAARITVSAVAFPKARRDLLTTIAKLGDGRLHTADDTTALAPLFSAELVAAVRTAAAAPTRAIVVRASPLVDGTGVDKAPAIDGYVTTKPRPTAHVLLVGNSGEPLLARWCLGAGNVATWTLDLDGPWSAAWVRWSGYAKFWTQLVRELRPSCGKP